LTRVRKSVMKMLVAAIEVPKASQIADSSTSWRRT
jgi:hypothetical protein